GVKWSRGVFDHACLVGCDAKNGRRDSAVQIRDRFPAAVVPLADECEWRRTKVGDGRPLPEKLGIHTYPEALTCRLPTALLQQGYEAYLKTARQNRASDHDHMIPVRAPQPLSDFHQHAFQVTKVQASVDGSRSSH